VPEASLTKSLLYSGPTGSYPETGVWEASGDVYGLLVVHPETPSKGCRAKNTPPFRAHATAMEEAAGVLSEKERLILLRLLKKLGKGGKDES
jgi:hypothetical protein